MGKNNCRKGKENINQGRRSFARNLLYLGITGAVLGVGGLAYLSERDARTGDVLPEEEEKIPENITFERAVVDGNLRQSYLEQLVAKEVKSTKEWNGFKKVVYDPKLRQFERDFGQKIDLIDESGSGVYGIGKSKRILNIAETLTTEPGKKSVCYASLFCFHPKVVSCEDEVKSVLDHEACHSYIGLIKDIKLNKAGLNETEAKEAVENASKEMNERSIELLCFDYQHEKVVSGKRRVGQKFIDRYIKPYSLLRKEMIKIQEQDNYDGKFARMLINSLRTNPELKKQGD